jgi:basic amino acid/polyamine antiporter, APA family
MKDFFKEILRIKPVEDFLEDLEKGPQLKRALGALGLISLGLGAIIGAGIFVITGQAAANYAGPAVAISFIIAGLGCAFAGLAYAEFAAMVPIAGSAYTYAYTTLGEFWAWFIAWNLVLEYLIAGSTVAVGWSGYFNSLLKDFGIIIPKEIASAPLDVIDSETKRAILSNNSATLIEKFLAFLNLKLTGSYFNFPAVLVIFLVGIVLLIGISESAIVNNIIVIIKVLVLLIFIVVGFGKIDPSNWTPFIPPSEGFGEYGITGILRAAGVVFFAYIGFDAVSTAAQEAKNPQKTLPIGILGSLAISTILYISVSLVLTGVVNYKELNVPDPIAVGIDKIGIPFLKLLVKLGALAGLTSVIMVTLLGQTRIFFSISRDGLLPPIFSKVHPNFKTPYISTIIVVSSAMLISAIFPIRLLGELVSIGTLLAFAIVSIAVLILRITRPDINRPFKTPAVWIVAPLGAIFSLVQMVFLPGDTWIRLIIWTIIGVSIYLLYGLKNSRLAKKQNNNE